MTLVCVKRDAHCSECNGELPCRRCNDDGVACSPSAQKRVDYKELDRRYAALSMPAVLLLNEGAGP